MYVCICHGITDRQIREALERGVTSLGELQCKVPLGSCCGRCLPSTQEYIDEHLAQLKNSSHPQNHSHSQRLQPTAA